MEPSVAELFRSLAALDDVSPEDVPALLAELERVRVRLWAGVLAPNKGSDSVLPSREPTSCLMTVAEVAAALRFSRAHVYELVRSGQLTAIRQGRAVRVSADALAEWQGTHRTGRFDRSDSVSLPSAHDRQQGEARQTGPGPDPAAVRRPTRSPQGNRGQVGNRRPGDEGTGGPPHRSSGSHRTRQQREAEPNQGETPRRKNPARG
jgi:excisionase family DNA binding protein